MNNILVIIVTYNAMQWIDKCINSILHSTIPANIFIIDNGSNDGTQTYIIQNYPSIIFVQNEQNMGFGKANNIGLQYALEKDYEYTYLLNQDAWIFPDTLEKLISIHKSYPEYGILSPMQMQANMKYLDCNFAIGACYKITNNAFISDLYNQSVKEVYEVPFVMAAHWLISKKCLRIVGGFSPSFPHYGEDNNWVQRAQFWGFKIGIVPNTKAVHDRENRKLTINHLIYFFYINLIIDFSDPLEQKKYLYLKMIKDCITLSIKAGSMKPFKLIYKFLMQKKTFRTNKKTSTEIQCAFLHDSKHPILTYCLKE